ncbi:MAG: hypothetical protein AB1756_09920 [Acidobacteriota bacterium]
MTAVIILIILVAALSFTLAPLFRKAEVDTSLGDLKSSASEELFLKKESLTEALKELEYDLSTGKISETDYRTLKEKYQKEIEAF